MKYKLSKKKEMFDIACQEGKTQKVAGWRLHLRGYPYVFFVHNPIDYCNREIKGSFVVSEKSSGLKIPSWNGATKVNAIKLCIEKMKIISKKQFAKLVKQNRLEAKK